MGIVRTFPFAYSSVSRTYSSDSRSFKGKQIIAGDEKHTYY